MQSAPSLCVALGLSASVLAVNALPTLAEAAVFPRSAPEGQCRTVRGRMALYNGTFSFRIWVVGTQRMLRVVDEDGDNLGDPGKLPRSLQQALAPYDGRLDQPRVFADYRVCDFTRRRPGVMQSVTLSQASNIRVEAD